MTTENQIIEGDCLTILPTIAANSVDLVITDPPYGIRYRDRAGRSIANDDVLDGVLGAFPHLYRVLKPDAFCVCFYSWSKIDQFFGAWSQAGFRPVGHLVWHKSYASSASFMESRHEMAYLLAKGRPSKPVTPLADVQSWEYTGNRAHPTEKAVGILSPLIKSFSSPGDIVLDPFSGSGSTSVAAALCGRRYLGIELESRYCAHARRRLKGVACHRERVGR